MSKRGRGSYRNRRSQNNRAHVFKSSLSKRDMELLLSEKPTDIVNELSREIKHFQHSLESELTKHIELVLKLLLKISGCLGDGEDVSSSAVNILGEVFLENRCPTFMLQLKQYIQGKVLDSLSPIENICLVSKLFHALLSRLPETFWCILPINELNDTVRILAEEGNLKEENDDLLVQVNSLIELYKAIKEQKEVRRLRPVVAGLRTWDNSEYREEQILPKWDEISKPKPPYRLRPNIVDGEYDDWLHYFDIQYRLLREDFISPLRKGIKDYHDGKVGRNLSNLRLYNRVRIVRPVFTSAGLCHEIQFDTSQFFNVDWEHNKRLIFGSLLCLSPDNFYRKVLFATVANRDPRKLHRGKVEVMFQDGAEVIVHRNQGTQFVMVESVAFFEASRHILRSLQIAEESTMPFTKYLIKSDSEDVNLPKYLARRNRQALYNMTLIVKTEVLASQRFVRKYSQLDIKNSSSWPPLEETQLDESQLLAMKMALTQEISVIQGPPGTGKTFIGLKIVKALLNNFNIWGNRGVLEVEAEHAFADRSPILVMCFTNHALDQFLEGIMDLDKEKTLKLIRVGGRSKNESLMECNLNAVKRRLRNVPRKEYQKMKQMKSNADTIGAVCLNMLRNYRDPTDDFVSFSRIKAFISEHHTRSLFEPAESQEERNLAIELWLGLYVKQVFEQLEPVEEDDLKEEEDQTDKSEYETDYSEDEYGDALQELQEKEAMEAETIQVVGEGIQEQEARLMEDTLELFKELKLDDVPIHNKPRKSKRTYNIRRVVKTDPCENHHYFLKSKMREITLAKMDDQVAEDIDDVYQLSLDERWELYKYWHFKYRSALLKDLEEQCMKYNKVCAEWRDMRQKNERYALETAHVIGMTTTGAAKYQHILHMLKPRIVIVEEAAEVLESHVVSALNAGTQQLILIGDHKQLRPKPNEYDLAVKYKLDISLFERLVNKNFPHATLQNQHRMRPEIAELVRPHIYETLYNHETVQNYPHIKGIGSDIFFISHTKPELRSDLSHSNCYESQYLVALCRYLLQHDYEPSQITILVTYSGQLLLMKNSMPKSEFEGVRVTTVDNYQGEENDIILLSLVRSNSNGVIGFLKEENRVCVSLSRAKHGFYCIGNFKMLRENSDVWQRIISDLESKNRVGDGLSIHCTNHPENKYIAKTPTDFAENSPRGGCKLDCGKRLSCGHTCTLKCHTSDSEHKIYQCRKQCSRTCPLGHKCHKLCYQECLCTEWVLKSFPYCDHEIEIMCHEDIEEYNCYMEVEKMIPKCRHFQKMRCHDDPVNVICQYEVERTLYCGHKHKIPCSTDQYLYQCDAIVAVKHPLCGHYNTLPCYNSKIGLLTLRCSSQCESVCPRGHSCRNKCHKPAACLPCSFEMTVTLPGCEHRQMVYCHQDPSQVDCMSMCEKKCERGHTCPRYCHEPCPSCRIMVKVTPKCGHDTVAECSKVNSFRCVYKVSKKLLCGHSVLAECSKPLESILCSTVMVKTLNCGHKQSVPCATGLDSAICKTMVMHDLDCGHKASGQCSVSKETIKCMYNLMKTLSCGHKKMMYCYENPDDVKCVVLTNKILSCGHSVKASCYKKVSAMECTKKCPKILPCGHSVTMSCNADIGSVQCNARISKKLPYCNHKVQLPCSEAYTAETISCSQICGQYLDCGHKCSNYCGERCSCSKKCERQLLCGHNCKNWCSEKCTTKCKALVVKEYPCGHKHRLFCYVPIENDPCDMFCRAPLACGHLCQGQCSDCTSTRVHKPCSSSVNLKHYCGEKVRLPCSGLADTHSNSNGQVISCSHKETPWKCFSPLPQCPEPCQWACSEDCPKPKKRCGRFCWELCDRAPCNEWCSKILECGHRCVGLCGEPCISLCPLCNHDQFASQHRLSKPFSYQYRYIQLPCGHIFNVTEMDKFVESPHTEVGPICCPVCSSPVSTSYRYGNLAKEALHHVEAVSSIIKQTIPSDSGNVLHFFSKIGARISNTMLRSINVPSLTRCVSHLPVMLNRRTFSSEETFLLFLLAQILEDVLAQSIRTETMCSIIDNICGWLFTLLKSPTLSYQTITDLTSEYFRFVLELKNNCIKHVETTKMLDDVGRDSKLRISRKMFLHHSKILENLHRKGIPYKATEVILSSMESFLPVVRNGSWRRCKGGHYYCIPVSRQGSLEVVCRECLGKIMLHRSMM